MYICLYVFLFQVVLLILYCIKNFFQHLKHTHLLEKRYTGRLKSLEIYKEILSILSSNKIPKSAYTNSKLLRSNSIGSDDGIQHESKKTSIVPDFEESKSLNIIKQSNITGGNFQTIIETVHPFYQVQKGSPGSSEFDADKNRITSIPESSQ